MHVNIIVWYCGVNKNVTSVSIHDWNTAISVQILIMDTNSMGEEKKKEKKINREKRSTQLNG